MDDPLVDRIIEVPASGSECERSAAFATTHWSVVLGAVDHDLEKAAAALHRLCSLYWYPIYAFIRRRGANVHEAEDLTQAFFAHLLEVELLRKVNQDKGRFRSFLLTALTNFLNNEWDKQQTLKRGGQRQIISLDEAAAEGFYRHEPAERWTPEKYFDRRWAAMLVDKVFEKLRQEYAATNHSALLARLESLLSQGVPAGRYQELAAEFNMTVGALKVAMHRLRRRFGELLRREVEHTVADKAALEDEIRYLLSAISE